MSFIAQTYLKQLNQLKSTILEDKLSIEIENYCSNLIYDISTQIDELKNLNNIINLSDRQFTLLRLMTIVTIKLNLIFMELTFENFILNFELYYINKTSNDEFLTMNVLCFVNKNDGIYFSICSKILLILKKGKRSRNKINAFLVDSDYVAKN